MGIYSFLKWNQTNVRHTKNMERLIPGNLCLCISTFFFIIYAEQRQIMYLQMQSVFMGILRLSYCISLAVLVSDQCHLGTVICIYRPGFNFLKGQYTYSSSKSGTLPIRYIQQAGLHLILCCKRMSYLETSSSKNRLHYQVTPKIPFYALNFSFEHLWTTYRNDNLLFNTRLTN